MPCAAYPALARLDFPGLQLLVSRVFFDAHMSVSAVRLDAYVPIRSVVHSKTSVSSVPSANGAQNYPNRRWHGFMMTEEPSVALVY